MVLGDCRSLELTCRRSYLNWRLSALLNSHQECCIAGTCLYFLCHGFWKNPVRVKIQIVQVANFNRVLIRNHTGNLKHAVISNPNHQQIHTLGPEPPGWLLEGSQTGSPIPKWRAGQESISMFLQFSSQCQNLKINSEFLHFSWMVIIESDHAEEQKSPQIWKRELVDSLWNLEIGIFF